jgi:hypothetical protein
MRSEAGRSESGRSARSEGGRELVAVSAACSKQKKKKKY